MTASVLSLLTSEDAREVLAAAVATVGEQVTAWHVDAVHARPGAETSVGYVVTTGMGTEYLVASDAELTVEQRARSRAVRLESPEAVLHEWSHPADPRLPGLQVACAPDLLAERWRHARGSEVDVNVLELLVLRPLRRAVVRAAFTAPDGTATSWFIKVVQPARAHALLDRHAMCELAPVAHDLGEGVVAVAAAAGSPITHALYRPHGGIPATIEPGMLLEVLERLPAQAAQLKRRAPVADRLGRYTAMALEQGLDRDAVREVERLVNPHLNASSPHGVTHGDFHPANVFVDSASTPRTVTALIDVDTLGPGRRVDDLSGMLAHLMVLPSLDADGYPTALETAEWCFDAFARDVGAAELRARTAANLVALASGAETPSVRGEWLALALDVARGTVLG